MLITPLQIPQNHDGAEVQHIQTIAAWLPTPPLHHIHCRPYQCLPTWEDPWQVRKLHPICMNRKERAQPILQMYCCLYMLVLTQTLAISTEGKNSFITHFIFCHISLNILIMPFIDTTGWTVQCICACNRTSLIIPNQILSLHTCCIRLKHQGSSNTISSGLIKSTENLNKSLTLSSSTKKCSNSLFCIPA